MSKCRRRDCRYRTVNRMHQWNCDYLSIAGATRLGKIAAASGKLRAKDMDPANCPLYEPRRSSEGGNWSREQLERLDRLYSQGMSDAKIAAQLGVSTTRVRMWRLRTDRPAGQRG